MGVLASTKDFPTHKGSLHSSLHTETTTLLSVLSGEIFLESNVRKYRQVYVWFFAGNAASSYAAGQNFCPTAFKLGSEYAESSSLIIQWFVRLINYLPGKMVYVPRIT